MANPPAVSAPRVAAVRHPPRSRLCRGREHSPRRRGPDRKLRGQELTPLMAELVKERVDVILTAGTSPTQAAKERSGRDPGRHDLRPDDWIGFVAGLARPEGNMTGNQFRSDEREMAGVAQGPDADGASNCRALQFKRSCPREFDGTRRSDSGAQLTTFELKNDNALVEALSSFQREHAEALIVTLPPAPRINKEALCNSRQPIDCRQCTGGANMSMRAGLPIMVRA